MQKIFSYRAEEPGKQRKLINSNSKILQVIRRNLNKNDIEDNYLHDHECKVPELCRNRVGWRSISVIYHTARRRERVLTYIRSLKSYNNDVKYGYIQRDLTEDEVEYLKLFEEEIEVRLKYRNQMNDG
ncbi:hypothetical protein Tco_0019860 [Tanacetum coccineum]